jgi:predicted nucleic acid-binding protein
MILIDTSAWVEFLRDTGSAACCQVEELLGRRSAICDPIRMEILAGARSESHVQDLRGLLARTTMLRTDPIDYDVAAESYRACRRNGETVRNFIDCLIASVALRHGMPILHCDADFEVLARHTRLEVVA